MQNLTDYLFCAKKGVSILSLKILKQEEKMYPETICFSQKHLPHDYNSGTDEEGFLPSYAWEEFAAMFYMHLNTINLHIGVFGTPQTEKKRQAEKAEMWIIACQKAMGNCLRPLAEADWTCICGTPLSIQDVFTYQNPMCPACRAKYYYVI